MPHHEIKICPHCHKEFECKAGSITECQCSQIILSNDERNYIESKFSDCLCIDCLKILQQEYYSDKNFHIHA